MPDRTLATLIAFAAISLATSNPAAAQNADVGKKVFRMHCAVCHAAVAGRKGIGPSLFGVVGRTAGTLEGYTYSAANKASGLTWDAVTLDRYLAAPQKIVPGTKMTFVGLQKDAERAAVITYLTTLK